MTDFRHFGASFFNISIFLAKYESSAANIVISITLAVLSPENHIPAECSMPYLQTLRLLQN